MKLKQKPTSKKYLTIQYRIHDISPVSGVYASVWNGWVLCQK